MSEVTTIGVDLAKNVFQVHGVTASGAVAIRRQLRRRQVLRLRAEVSLLRKQVPLLGHKRTSVTFQGRYYLNRRTTEPVTMPQILVNL